MVTIEKYNKFVLNDLFLDKKKRRTIILGDKISRH
jgi:hypothetical protein